MDLTTMIIAGGLVLLFGKLIGKLVQSALAYFLFAVAMGALKGEIGENLPTILKEIPSMLAKLLS